MPCTKDVLNKHIQRSVYQAAIWRNALNAIVDCPNIINHGWLVDENGNLSINWMDLPPAPDGILENIECSCKKAVSVVIARVKKRNYLAPVFANVQVA